jgi:hypothetical protein
MNKIDIENALGVSTLNDLHLGLRLDDLFAMPIESKWLALCALRFKAPATHAMVSPMHQYTSQAAVSLLCAVLGNEVEADDLVGELFQAATGQSQAENLLLSYALYVACFRLAPVADLSVNSFSELLEQANFNNEAFRWFYVLHLGRMSIKHGVDFDLGRVGMCLPLFSVESHERDLLESFHAVQSFCKHYPKALFKMRQDEGFKAVLSHLYGIGSLDYLDRAFDSFEGFLSIYGQVV